MAPSCLFLILSFLVFVLATSADVDPADRPSLYETIINNVEDARVLMQKISVSDGIGSGDNDSIPVNLYNLSDSCVLSLNEASLTLSSVEEKLLKEDVPSARDQLSKVMLTVSDCSKQSNSVQEFGEILSVLESASTSINRLIETTSDGYSPADLTSTTEKKPNSEATTGDAEDTLELEALRGGGGGGASCSRDGALCQFSACGRGKALTRCAFGFAQGVTGGAAGPTYVVTRSDDNPRQPAQGSLRYAVALGGGRRGVWITFANSMIIELNSMLWVRSSTTIDGRGFNITINGHMLVVGGVSNVIIHNIQVSNMPQSDTIHIFAGSSKVWVDHVTSFNAKLGLVSVVQRSTDVTISNCQLSNRNFNMLLGASDTDVTDKNLRVTVYRNWFKDSMQRMPHCRWGYCHVVNNLYTNWGFYAIGGRVHARIFSEGNVFIADRRREVTPWFTGASRAAGFDNTALIQSRRDLLLNGSTFHQFGRPASTSGAANVNTLVLRPPYPTSSNYPPLLSNIRRLPDLVRSCSGARFGPGLQRCLRSYLNGAS